MVRNLGVAYKLINMRKKENEYQILFLNLDKLCNYQADG